MSPADGELLDDLLSRWHHWQQSERVVRGFNRKALVIGDFKISRQYDDANGQLDADLEDRIMRQVDFQVRQMEDPHRAAIYVNARALLLGVMVFTSPRLPSDTQARRQMVLQARCMLAHRLAQHGLMSLDTSSAVGHS
jgi:hypothetical protein